MTKRSLLALIILVSWLCITGTARSENMTSIREFATRSNASVRAIVLTPEKPIGYVVLLPGGDGDIGLSPSGAISAPHKADNFVVRTRSLYANAGLIAIVPNVASDIRFGLYDKESFYKTIEDYRAIAITLKKERDLPIWFVGTSASAARLAMMTPSLERDIGIAGIALTSTVLSHPKMSLGDAAKITVPVLVVHHRQDACFYCKPEAVQPFLDTLQTSSKKLVWIQGGVSIGNPCWELAYHGYNGVETAAVGAITSWIKGER